MKDRFREEYSKNLKWKIRVALNNIDGYTREEMITLEFIYGAIRKFLPKDGGIV